MLSEGSLSCFHAKGFPCEAKARLIIALTMEAASTSETSVNFYQTTRRNNPEDNHLKTLHVSITKISWLTLFRELIAVYSDNHTQHINTLWAKCRVIDC
jgi:hypothetical protein